MDEYIERETAVKAANEWVSEACMAPVMRVSRLFDKLQKVPAADVVPVVHGRWEMRSTGMATDTGPEYKAYCTVCNEPNKQYQPPFCPHCGAKMDGGDSE